MGIDNWRADRHGQPYDLRERFIPPTVGYVGFRGAAAVTPPVTWQREHDLAEAGGYFREGRYWRRPDTKRSVVKVPCTPVDQLYASMIARIRGTAAALDMGYVLE